MRVSNLPLIRHLKRLRGRCRLHEQNSVPKNSIDVLVSAGWLGGAGGAERNLYSTLRALEDDRVDIVIRKHLDGAWSLIGNHVRVMVLDDCRWYGAGHSKGLKGAFLQRVVNPLRRLFGRRYDVHIRLLGGGHIIPAVQADLTLLVPSGNPIELTVAAGYDAVALQAPDNEQLVPRGVMSVLLPPPVYDLASAPVALAQGLPPEYFLTVFNPYDPIKGLDDLGRALESTPLPIVWCHSARTVTFDIPEAIDRHPLLVHVDDPSPAEMRYLYEHCRAYLAFSRSEGFGWSAADALRYSRAVVTRAVGVFSNPEAWQPGTIRIGEAWEVDWDEVLAVREETVGERDLTLLAASTYRDRLLELLAQEQL